MKARKIILAIAILVIAGGVYAYYLYNKKTVDTRTTSAEEAVAASQLVKEFNENESAADKKYVGKVVQVSGIVKEVKADSASAVTVILDGGDPMAAVTCSFYDTEAEKLKALEPNEQVQIKGICIGKLMDVVLNKCSLIKK